MSFTTAQADGILGIAIFMSTLSFIGSSIIIASYFAFPNLRKFSFRLVVHMAVADWFSCIAYFMANPTDGSAACTFQGLLEQGCQLSSIIWTTIISLTLWMAVVKREEVHTHMRTFLIVGYVLPALTCILPLSTKSFVNTGAWCWIDGETTIGQVWRFLLFVRRESRGAKEIAQLTVPILCPPSPAVPAPVGRCGLQRVHLLCRDPIDEEHVRDPGHRGAGQVQGLDQSAQAVRARAKRAQQGPAPSSSGRGG
jgi:hypothetical protein